MPNFKQLLARLSELKAVPSRCAKAASVSIAKLIDREFDEGADPYGEGWADLAESTLSRGRHPPPLTDNRELRDSISVRPTASSGIEIRIGSPYATFHQTGTKNMPKRAILPDQSELPESWEDAIASAFQDALRVK